MQVKNALSELSKAEFRLTYARFEMERNPKKVDADDAIKTLIEAKMYIDKVIADLRAR